MERTLYLILAEADAPRLRPLTRHCPLPLLRLGPSARLIDFTLYNCLLSGAGEVMVLSPEQSAQMEAHLEQEWRPAFARQGAKLCTFSPEPNGPAAVSGPAALVYQALAGRKDAPELVVLLWADSVYQLDYRPLIEQHRKNGAAGTILGAGFSPEPPGRPAREAELGVYVFTRRQLLAYLEPNHSDPALDFRRDLLRRMAPKLQLHRWTFASAGAGRGYWHRVQDLAAYYQAQMDLLSPAAYPLYRALPLAGRRPPLSRSELVRRELGPDRWIYHSLISPRARIGEALIENSVIGPGVVIADGAVVENSVLLDGAVIHRWVELDTALVGPGMELKTESEWWREVLLRPEDTVEPRGVAAWRSDVLLKALRRKTKPQRLPLQLAAKRAEGGRHSAAPAVSEF